MKIFLKNNKKNIKNKKSIKKSIYEAKKLLNKK